MPVGGKVREAREYKKSTGFFEAEVVAVNPDREALSALLGTELEKDPEYLSENPEDHKKTLMLRFWLRDVKSKEIKNVAFFLKDKVSMNRDKTKTEYLNNIGALSWAATESDLQAWFTARSYRPAHEGEKNLYAFMTAWLNKLDWKDAEATLSFTWDQLMRGNVREIRDCIGSPYGETVVCLSTIKTVTKDGDTKEYENIYNQDFMPGYLMREIRLKQLNTAFIEKAKATERKKRNKLQKFVLQVVDSEHGIKDFYTLAEATEYDPTQNVASGTATHINNDDTSY